jgi:hypothetical protein
MEMMIYLYRYTMSRVSFNNKNNKNKKRYPGMETKTVRHYNNINAQVHYNKQVTVQRGLKKLVQKMMQYDDLETVLTRLTNKEKNVLGKKMNKTVIENLNVYENRKRSVVVQLSNIQYELSELINKLKPLL